MSKVTKIMDPNAGLVFSKKLISKDSARQTGKMAGETIDKIADEVCSKKASDALQASVVTQIKKRKKVMDTNVAGKGISQLPLPCPRLDYYNKEFGGCIKSIEFDKAKNKYNVFEVYKDGNCVTLTKNKDEVRLKLENYFTDKKEDIIYIPAKITEEDRKCMFIGKKDGNVDLAIAFAKDGVTIEEIGGAKEKEFQYLIGQKLDNKDLERHFGRPLNITPEEIAEYKKALEDDRTLTLDYLGNVLPKIYQEKPLSTLDRAVSNAFIAREQYLPNEKSYHQAMNYLNDVMKHYKFKREFLH